MPIVGLQLTVVCLRVVGPQTPRTVTRRALDRLCRKQDRDGALLVLNRRTRRFFPFIKFIFADAGYRGQKTAAAIAKTGTWKLTIVQRNELHRFAVLPKRWIVERTLAWISHSRRLARDFERYARSAAAFIRLAMIRIMLRRLTNPTLCS